MNVKDLKTKYHLEPDDLPNRVGNNIVTIVSLDSEPYTDNSGGKSVKKVRHNLWFRELSLPLRLNNTRLDVLAKLLGDETDNWRGRKIALFNGASSSFGQTKAAIFISLEAQDATPGNGNPAQLNAAGASAPIDIRPIGDNGADRFKQALAEQGATFDEFMRWLRKESGELHGRCFGLELGDLPRAALPLMARFLKEYPQSPKQPPDAVPPPEDDDIPF